MHRHKPMLGLRQKPRGAEQSLCPAASRGQAAAGLRSLPGLAGFSKVFN